jgi:hypothetical protein
MSQQLYPTSDQATQQPTLFDAPDPRDATWRAFTLGHDEDDAAATFLRRYGQPPCFVFKHLGLLKVGPVPGVEVTR